MSEPWKTRLIWLLLLANAVLAGAKLLVLYPPERWSDFRSTGAQGDAQALRAVVYDVLFDYGILPEWISGDSLTKWVDIPRDLPLVEPYCALLEGFERRGGQILAAAADPKGRTSEIRVGLNDRPLLKVTLRRAPTLERQAGRLAVVVIGVGRHWDERVRAFLALDVPVTFSVLPGQKRSERVARAAAERGHQVLLQWPEPTRNGKTRPGERELRQRLRRAQEAVPQAVGLSLVTGPNDVVPDTELSTLMAALRRQAWPVLFVGGTDCRLAGQSGLPCAGTTTLLDAIQEEPFVRERFYRLADAALDGRALVCATRPSRAAANVLAKEIRKLKQKGFEFITFTEAVNTQAAN